MKRFKEGLLSVLVFYFCAALAAAGAVCLVGNGYGNRLAILGGVFGVALIALAVFLFVKYIQSDRYRVSVK